MSKIRFAVVPLFALASALTSIEAQSSLESRKQLLAEATRVIITDMRSRDLNPTVSSPDTKAWRIVGPSIDSTSDDGFERAILQAMFGRRSTGQDSLAETLTLHIAQVGDSASVSIDRGRPWCARGQPSAVGMVYRYSFSRSNGAWRVTERKPGIIYDPPPTPREVIVSDACARAIAR